MKRFVLLALALALWCGGAFAQPLACDQPAGDPAPGIPAEEEGGAI